MKWKLTYIDDQPRQLPGDIEVVGGIDLADHLVPTKDNESVVYRAESKARPITLTLAQPLGADKTLWELFGKKAGFKLKLTLSAPSSDGAGGIILRDVLDIDLQDLVPEHIAFNEVVQVSFKTSPCQTLFETVLSFSISLTAELA